MRESPVRVCKKVVLLLRDKLGDRPEVVGLCSNPEGCNSCDLCRSARVGSIPYMTHLYASWSIDSLSGLIDVFSDLESRIHYDIGREDKLKKLYKNFSVQFDIFRKKSEVKVKEYKDLQEGLE